MGVILTDNVTNGTGRLHVRLARRVARLVHSVQNAAMHRLQAVAHIRQSTRHDNGHRVLEERGLHLLAKESRAHRSALAAVGALDDGAVGVGHVHHHSASALLFGDDVLGGVFIHGGRGAGQLGVLVALLVGVYVLGQVKLILFGGFYLVAVVELVDIVKIISHLALLKYRGSGRRGRAFG